MMLEYKAIEIFTSEGARCRNKPVANAVMEYVKELKIAARCIITQGDLIQKGGLPLRLGLLAESGQNHLETVLKAMAARKASEVMTTPVITIADDRLLTEAVDLMLARKIKRLPVVDATGKLVGMLSRLDIFRTVMHASPDWKSFQAQQIEVDHLKKVGDILRRDTHTVSPETPLDEVLRVIDQNDIQRIVVVDAEGKLLGLISDRDLLQFFKQKQNEFWGFLSTIKQAFKPDSGEIDSAECLAETTAEAVMTTGLITVNEEMLIEEAIGLMTTKALKRLPVVDEKGRFKGMISRDSLLRTGFSGTNIKDQNAKET